MDAQLDFKIKLRTEKSYKTCNPYTADWTQEDWDKVAVYRTEPRKIRFSGYVWRACARNEKGQLLYRRAEKE
jgi:hypothetical protein